MELSPQVVLDNNKDKQFVDRIFNPSKYPTPPQNSRGEYMTHQMGAEVDPETGEWYVFPNVVLEDGKYRIFEDGQEARKYNQERGEAIRMPNKESAIAFSKGYKPEEFKDYYRNMEQQPQKRSATTTLSNGRSVTFEASSQEEAESIIAELEEDIATASRNAAVKAENDAQIEEFFGGLVTTPLGEPPPVPERQPIGPAGPMGPAPTIPTPSNDPSRLNRQAWEDGIDVRSGADLGDRWALGLAEFQDGFFKFQLAQELARENFRANGKEVPENINPVYYEPNTGRLTVMRPITGDDVERYGEDPNNVGGIRATLVDPVGFDLGDMVEFAPNAPVMAAEIAAGAFATRNPAISGGRALATSSAYSGLINSLSVPVRKKILKEFYGMTDEQIDEGSKNNEWLIQGLLAGGGELGLGGVMEAIRRVRNKAGVIDPKDIPKIREEHERILREIEELGIVAGRDLEFTPEAVMSAAGLKSDSFSGTQIGIWLQNKMRRGTPADKEVQLAGDLNQQLQIRSGYESVVNQAITDVDDPAVLAQLAKEQGVYAPNPDVPSDERMLRAREIINETDLDGTSLNRALDDAQLAADAQEEFISIMEREIQPSNFGLIETATMDGVARANEAVQLTWQNLRQLTGVLPSGKSAVQVRNTFRYLPDGQGMAPSPVRAALQDVSKEGREALSNKLGTKSAKLVEDLQAMNGPNVTFDQLTRLQSQLKKELRAMKNARPSNFDGYATEQIQKINDAIDAQIAQMDFVRIGPDGKEVVLTAAEKAKIVDAYSIARDATIWQKQVAQADTIRDMTATRPRMVEDANGNMRLQEYQFDNAPREAITKMLGSRESLQQVLDITKNDPAVKAAFAKEMQTLFNNKVYPGGKFSTTGMTEFRNQFSDQADLIFGPDDWARISNAETMQAAVQRSAKKAEAVQNLYIETFGDQFIKDAKGRLAPDSFVKGIFQGDNLTAQQTRNFYNRINEIDPALAAQFRAETAQWMTNQLTSGPALKSGGNAIRTLIGKNEAKIGAVMGAKYVENLKKVARVLDIDEASRTVRPSGDVVQSIPLQAFRAIFGPLSRKQRFLTAYNRYSRSVGARKAIEIMSDPKMLEQFVKLEKIPPRSFVFRSLAARLGIEGILEMNGITYAEDPRQDSNIPSTDRMKEKVIDRMRAP